MEVFEIITSFVSRENNHIQVEFRFIEDKEPRHDTIEYKHFQDFGYDTSDLLEVFDFGDEDDWDDVFDDDEIFIDEDTMVSFLNEYYLLYPDKIPEKEL